MVELHLKIVSRGKLLDFKEAFQTGVISFDDHCLYSNSADLLLSTLLFDADGQEIYEGDVLLDDKNCKYNIVYKDGAFFALQKSNGSRMIPLYLLQGSGYIPAKIQKKQI